MERAQGTRVDTDASSKVTKGLAHATVAVAAAYVRHNPLSPADLPALLRAVHAALAGIRTGVARIERKLDPAVPISHSVTPDYIICLEDGKRFKSMKRHLRGLGLTPVEYRKKWGLSGDYPMVAPNYSSKRSRLAKDIGLGVRGKPDATAKIGNRAA